MNGVELDLDMDGEVDTEEAAVLVDLKPATLRWYRSRGGGPPFIKKGPKVVKYRRGKLKAWKAAREQECRVSRDYRRHTAAVEIQ